MTIWRVPVYFPVGSVSILIHFYLRCLFACLFSLFFVCLLAFLFSVIFGINWNKVRGGDGFAQLWAMSGFCNTMFGKREWEGRKRKTT